MNLAQASSRSYVWFWGKAGVDGCGWVWMGARETGLPLQVIQAVFAPERAWMGVDRPRQKNTEGAKQPSILPPALTTDLCLHMSGELPAHVPLPPGPCLLPTPQTCVFMCPANS